MAVAASAQPALLLHEAAGVPAASPCAHLIPRAASHPAPPAAQPAPQSDMYTASGQLDGRTNRIIQKIYESPPPVGAAHSSPRVAAPGGCPCVCAARTQPRLLIRCFVTPPIPPIPPTWFPIMSADPFCRPSGGGRCWTRCSRCSRRPCCTAGEGGGLQAGLASYARGGQRFLLCWVC